jgi:hypothetical protein
MTIRFKASINKQFKNMSSEKMMKIYHNIMRGDEIILDAGDFIAGDLEKIARCVGTSKGSMVLKNSSRLPKHTVRNISNMSKQKVVFDYSSGK